MSPWIGVVGVPVALGLVIGILRLFQERIPRELSRKAVHVGMGAICLTFPWLFREAWPVLLLALFSTVGLACIRWIPALRKRLGNVMGGVERQSYGEFYFPLAVVAVFLFSQGDALLFVIPVLTLTVADSVGALIGVRYGLSRYRTDEGMKSAEGSFAFFIAAFLSCHVPLLLFSGVGRAESLLIGLTAGMVVMLLEAISWRGQDNLIIPVGMFFLLEFYVPMQALDLLVRFLLLVALVCLVVALRRRTTLSESALFAAALSGYAVWAFGGSLWLAPPLVLFLIYIALPAIKEPRPVQGLHAITRVMAGGFLWILLSRLLPDQNFSLAYLVCMAAHAANITTARLRVVRPSDPLIVIAVIGWLIPTALFTLLGWGGSTLGLWTAGQLVWIPVAIALSVLMFIPAWPVEHRPDQKIRIWLSETGIAFFASCFALIW